MGEDTASPYVGDQTIEIATDASMHPCKARQARIEPAEETPRFRSMALKARSHRCLAARGRDAANAGMDVAKFRCRRPK
jgi:hypothetical protein